MPNLGIQWRETRNALLAAPEGGVLQRLQTMRDAKLRLQHAGFRPDG